MDEPAACREFLSGIGAAYRLRAVKTYRVPSQGSDGIPLIPCLDHEAGLHGRVPLHVSAYVEDPASGDLHEVGYYPSRSLVVVDLVSTAGEHREASDGRLRGFLAERFPACRVRVSRPSRIRGDQRAAEAARAQVTLREVLLGPDLETTTAALGRLQAVAALMEKESRVASWGVRTAATPILAAAGVVLYLLLDKAAGSLGPTWATGLRYAALTGLGGALMYLGMKAVHLTEISNRVWKRATEYGLILAERRRLEKRGR
jgi:hypothetical protein